MLNFNQVHEPYIINATHFGQGYSCQLISLDNVRCDGDERTLLECQSIMCYLDTIVITERTLVLNVQEILHYYLTVL